MDSKQQLDNVNNAHCHGRTAALNESITIPIQSAIDP